LGIADTTPLFWLWYLFLSCSLKLVMLCSPAMTTTRQKEIMKKRRMGIGPKCRKRTLMPPSDTLAAGNCLSMPKAICEVDQPVAGRSGYSNLQNSESGGPQPIRKRGGQKGNRNRLKHGRYTKERRSLMAAVRAHIQAGRECVAWARSSLR
jgi:hypothetical protein